MSDRVDWVTCPRCGRTAAVGWTVDGADGDPGRQIPTEYDCVSGCELSDGELRTC
jgi:hypothetical protein